MYYVRTRFICRSNWNVHLIQKDCSGRRNLRDASSLSSALSTHQQPALPAQNREVQPLEVALEAVRTQRNRLCSFFRDQSKLMQQVSEVNAMDKKDCQEKILEIKNHGEIDDKCMSMHSQERCWQTLLLLALICLSSSSVTACQLDGITKNQNRPADKCIDVNSVMTWISLTTTSSHTGDDYEKRQRLQKGTVNLAQPFTSSSVVNFLTS